MATVEAFESRIGPVPKLLAMYNRILKDLARDHNATTVSAVPLDVRLASARSLREVQFQPRTNGATNISAKPTYPWDGKRLTSFVLISTYVRMHMDSSEP